jgi:methionine synthase I (cobalamin-dependent)
MQKSIEPRASWVRNHMVVQTLQSALQVLQVLFTIRHDFNTKHMDTVTLRRQVTITDSLRVYSGYTVQYSTTALHSPRVSSRVRSCLPASSSV